MTRAETHVDGVTVTSTSERAVAEAYPPAPHPGAEAVTYGALPPGFPTAGGHPVHTPPPGRVERLAQRLWTRSPVWAAPAALLVCMGGAVGYTLAVDPTAAGADAEPSCLLKYTTGFVCPGCGGTRAAWFLLHGDLPAAARHHALFVFLVPFLLYLYVAWAAQRVFGRRLPQPKVGPKAIGALLAVWAVFSVLRNLPWAPFTLFFV